MIKRNDAADFQVVCWIPAGLITSPQREGQSGQQESASDRKKSDFIFIQTASKLLCLNHQIHKTRGISGSYLFLSVPPPVCLCRSEAAEVGGSAWRLDPWPGRQNAAQEEVDVQQEEVVWPSAGRREDAREQEEEEVKAALFVDVDFKDWWCHSCLAAQASLSLSRIP